MAHRDPARLPLLRTLRDRYPLRADEPSRIGDVMRTGEPQLIEPTDAWLQPIAENEEHLGLLRELAMGSVISVPMTAAAKIVGALVFVNEIGSRSFDAHDLEIASEVARRAAIADRERADRRRARADGGRAPARAAAAEPSPDARVGGGDHVRAGRRDQRGRRRLLRGVPVEGGWAVLLGDVSGKGAAAAAVTAEARHTIRTAGTLAADPVAGLHLLDQALRGRDDVALCSVALVVLPDSSAGPAQALVYLAGHPHPILLRNGAATRGRAGPAARGGRRPDLDPDRGHARARRPARPLHRRRDRGPRRRQRPLRQRPPPPRGSPGARPLSSRSSVCAGRSRVRRPRARRRRGAGRDPPRLPRRRAGAAPGGGRAAGRDDALMEAGPATDDDRRPLLFLCGGAATAVVSIALAGVAGPPYLALDSLSPVDRHLRDRPVLRPVRDPVRDLRPAQAAARGRRPLGTGRAVVGAGRRGVLVVAALCGLPSGYDAGTLGGAIALVAGTEAVLVLATLVVWLISG